jgi:hypothetical protein
MKKILLNSKEYNCPESFNEVTLKQQIQVSRDTEKINNDMLKKMAILSGYANIEVSELKKIKISELTSFFKLVSFINEPLDEKTVIEFDFNGSHYYCGQNIVDMEFQDFISIENALQQTSGNTYNALPVILAVMCKKMKADGKLESLDDYDLMKRSVEFENLPITIAHGLSLFFYNNAIIFTNLTGLFSNPQKLVEIRIQEVNNILKKLVGKGLLIRFVNLILRYCLKSIKRQQDKLYTSTQ